MKHDSSPHWFLKHNRSFIGWLLLGILVSLIIHLVIISKIKETEISSFNPASFDTIVPRRFHLERVDIDPKLLEEPKENKKEVISPAVEVTISEKNNFSDLEEVAHQNESKPGILDTKNLLEEQPKDLINSKILSETTQQPQQPLIEWDKKAVENNTSLGTLVTNQATTLGNYSQLDQLVDQKVPLSAQTAPILLPTDLLFEYNADRLKLEAEKSLNKLAILIQRNPKAQFIIEGFTDSFGSDTYNLDLSLRRAQSIKQWLSEHHFIDNNQIKTYGFGKTHFLVPANGTIQQQQLNRRVEIVIHY